MNLFYAVIDDLYSFVLDELFLRHRHAQLPMTEEREESDTVIGETFITRQVPETTSLAVPPARSLSSLMNERLDDTDVGGVHTIMYIGGGETPLYKNPTREFDSIVTRLPYGAMAMVLEQQGRWARISSGNETGWILRDDLVDRAAHVYPHFISGGENTAEDPNTIRIRAILNDAFGGGAAELDLQSSEYVAYRLMRKGLAIDWPPVRPRTPGSWHAILKGVSGIHIGITPKTGSIMEYMVPEEEMGRLAYVEAVFPDEMIDISEVGPERGIYHERVLARDEWRELHPLFIQVT